MILSKRLDSSRSYFFDDIIFLWIKVARSNQFVSIHSIKLLNIVDFVNSVDDRQIDKDRVIRVRSIILLLTNIYIYIDTRNKLFLILR